MYITRLHDLTPKVGGKRVGAKVKGICVSGAQRIVEGSMEFERQAQPSEVPPVKFYLMRHFPGIEDTTRPDIHEKATSRVADPKVADVWVGKGKASLRLRVRRGGRPRALTVTKAFYSAGHYHNGGEGPAQVLETPERLPVPDGSGGCRGVVRKRAGSVYTIRAGEIHDPPGGGPCRCES